ncbi:MAG: homoserine kinase [Candidatus Dormibacteraeota bacterium]|nr:homoserine kinase [Candidatus Dormibacteraeota bacterium]
MRVRVPGSIANLGPGFDVLAMAVELWLEVEAEPADQPDWTFEGEGAELLNIGPNPLSVLRMRGRVRNGIPVGVGLGSSAAARVAAHALRGHPEPWLAAAREEGHADNAVAAALGGLRLVVEGRIEELPVPDLEVALLVAVEPQSTDAAREALPAKVPLAEAAANAGRLARLVHLLHGSRITGSPEALADLLHQPYRRALYPWTATAMEAANRLGAPAAVSGAGPSVFALCVRGTGKEVAEAMAAAAPGRGLPVLTEVARSGMCLEP